MPFWAAAGPAIIGAAAQIIGGERANRRVSRMSDTAHQREVADLRAAGLNPILSATGGSGATTPNQQNVMEGVANSALAVARARQEIRNLKAQEAVSVRQAENIGLQSEGLIQDNIGKFNYAGQSGAQARADLEGSHLSNDSVREALKGLEVQGRLNSQTIGQLWDRLKGGSMTFGEFIAILSGVLGNASSAVDIARRIAPAQRAPSVRELRIVPPGR